MLAVRRLDATAPVARELLAAMEDEVRRVYGPLAQDRTSLVAPAEMAAPRGVYVVLEEDGDPVAGGGVRPLGPLGDGVGEVKRMFVTPACRGRGVGRRLLAELEAAARDLGFERLRLDTAGTGRRLYERAGYRAIGDYNGNTYATFWGEKAL